MYSLVDKFNDQLTRYDLPFLHTSIVSLHIFMLSLFMT